MQPLLWFLLALFPPCYALSEAISPCSGAARLPLLPQPQLFTLDDQLSTLNDKINFAHPAFRRNSPLSNWIQHIAGLKIRKKTHIWSLIIPSRRSWGNLLSTIYSLISRRRQTTCGEVWPLTFRTTNTEQRSLPSNPLSGVVCLTVWAYYGVRLRRIY